MWGLLFFSVPVTVSLTFICCVCAFKVLQCSLFHSLSQSKWYSTTMAVRPSDASHSSLIHRQFTSCAHEETFTSNRNNHVSTMSPLMFRCLMDSGGGTPPGPPPDPCHSTSAPSLPLPQAQTWTAALSIQSEGEEQFLGLQFHKAQNPVKCMKYSFTCRKIPTFLFPKIFNQRAQLQQMLNWW